MQRPIQSNPIQSNQEASANDAHVVLIQPEMSSTTAVDASRQPLSRSRESKKPQKPWLAVATLGIAGVLLTGGGVSLAGGRLSAAKSIEDYNKSPTGQQDVFNLKWQQTKKYLEELASQPGGCASSPASWAEDEIYRDDTSFGKNPDCKDGPLSDRGAERLSLYQELRELREKIEKINQSQSIEDFGKARKLLKEAKKLRSKTTTGGILMLVASMFAGFAGVYLKKAHALKTEFLDDALKKELEKITIPVNINSSAAHDQITGLKIVQSFIDTLTATDEISLRYAGDAFVLWSYDMALFKEIRSILITEVPEDANSPNKHPLLLAKENILLAMHSGLGECATIRKHTTNRLLMILNSAIDPANAPTQEIKKRTINSVIYNQAEILLSGAINAEYSNAGHPISGYDTAAHAMLTNLKHFITFVEECSKLKTTRKPLHNFDTTNLIWPGDGLLPHSIIPDFQLAGLFPSGQARKHMRKQKARVEQQFKLEGLVAQFLECDIWVEHINHHFSDLINEIREKIREDIDYSDTSAEGLAKMATIDLEEKTQIYALQKAITSLYLTSGQEEALPSNKAVEQKIAELKLDLDLDLDLDLELE